MLLSNSPFTLSSKRYSSIINIDIISIDKVTDHLYPDMSSIAIVVAYISETL